MPSNPSSMLEPTAPRQTLPTLPSDCEKVSVEKMGLNLKTHEEESLKWAYEFVFARRLHYEDLLWQVPAMSFTGQAFLFTIALSSTSSTAARVISMAISMLISYLTAGTFAKHSLMENADSIWLKRAEVQLFPIDLPWVGSDDWRPNGHGHLDMAWPDRHDIWRAPILKRSAKGNSWLVYNWIWGIRFVLATAGAILIISIVKADWINSPPTVIISNSH